MVVKALNKEDLARSSIGHIIKDIKSMSSLLQIHSFYTKRQGNTVARALVRTARFSFPLEV